MTKRILLVDDQERFLSALKQALEGAGYVAAQSRNGSGYVADLSNSGTGALGLLGLNRYDAIICDVNMPGMNGYEFLRKSREVSNTPVILMTGFKEIADADRASREGARGFIAKPFRLEEIRKLLDGLTAAPEPQAEPESQAEPRDLDDEYFPLLIGEFLSGKTIQYDIFIRFSATKYLKIAHGGEDLDPARIAKFREKGLRVLYLRKEDYKRYVAFLINLTTRMAAAENIEHHKKMRMLKLAGEVTLKGMFEGTMGEPELGEAKLIVNSMHRIVCEDEKLGDLLAALKESGDAHYAHAMSVSVVSVMLAQALQWTSQASIMSVGLAGFFHDIGKKEFPPEMLQKSRLKYTPQEAALYETHPVRGADLLSRVPRFPPEVIQAVIQHHEACSGVGFPKHLTKNKIIPIARIISIADEFAKNVLSDPDGHSLTPREAFERIKTVKGDDFDQEYLKAFEKLLC